MIEFGIHGPMQGISPKTQDFIRILPVCSVIWVDHVFIHTGKIR